MSILEKLKKNRTPILLAEVGAYLHDLGKARIEFVGCHSESKVGWDRDKHNFPSILPESLREALSGVKLKICDKEAALLDFIEKHHKKKDVGEWGLEEIPELIKLIRPDYNGYDGVDSGVDKGSAREKQRNVELTFIATAFGYEERRVGNEEQTKKLYEHIQNAIKSYTKDGNIKKLREKILHGIREIYLNWLGETRRSANDVTLWDHSYSVAALFKCAVAKNVIDCSQASFDPLTFNWSILGVNMDVLRILRKGIKLGDILSYLDKIETTFEKIKELIEIEYPLGNEIYRDTSGIYFLIPDIQQSFVEELKRKIIDEINSIEPELMCTVLVTSKDKPETTPGELEETERRRKIEKEIIKPILKGLLLNSKEKAFADINYPTSNERFALDSFISEGLQKEICPICRLRLMRENAEGCEYCIDRRKRRSEEWIETPKITMWLDEVSDLNDLVALIVGCLNLDKWLDGSFIKTMAIKVDDITPEPKNSSPARIRRCWETTLFFMQAIFEKILNNYDWTPDLRTQRIEFKIEPNPNIPGGSTCDIEVEGWRFSPVCINREKGIFVSTINLEILETFGKSAREIADYLKGKKIRVKTGKDRVWMDRKNSEPFRITEAKPADEKFQNYLPYVRIYDFPDQFMVLVPACESLDIAERILKGYEIQFSKVRDRLPFHLGVIAFHRKTPLYVVMDAGKRLIEAFKKNTKTVNAKVISIGEVENEEFGNKVKMLTLQAGSYSPVPFQWKISYSTGDPAQEDLWHPYIRFSNGNPNRLYSFDYTGDGDYVVHIKCIEENDQIMIEPSYFRLFYLENAADRFKVDEKLELRPIHEVHRLKELWKKIEEKLESGSWSISQVHAFWEDVTKRRNYGNDIFERFVKSDLINILGISPQKDGELFEKILQATKDGLLDLCLHWNIQVRKIKPKRKIVG